MYRALLFDLDGVLTTDKTGSRSTLRSLAQHTGLPEETLHAAYYRHNRALLAGRTTHQAMWPDFCREAGADVPFALLHTAFTETPMDADVLHLARDMKAAGCLIALVTDNKADRVEAILDHNGLRDLFDALSVSAQVGSGKEARAIFEDALRKLGVTPGECIFIDNTARNLVVPAEMGMATYLFDDQERDVEVLRARVQEPIWSCCGMRCDLCRLYRPNVERRDERPALCAVFRKVWPGFAPDAAQVICDGCTCEREGAALFSPDCAARACVLARELEHCGQCLDYPCAAFPAEPTQAELEQAIDVEHRWTWQEERLMMAYRCRENVEAWRREQTM